AGKLSTQSAGPMLVGAHGNEPFHGDLNDVRLYRSGLNGLQIQSIASGEKGIAGDELMGSWSLPDEAKPKVEQPVERIAHERIEKFLLKAFHSPADEKTGKLYSRYFDKQYQKSGDFTESMKDVVSAAKIEAVHNNGQTSRIGCRIKHFMRSQRNFSLT
ncbi:hypothetical protein OAG78_01210, partial [bacterium]|nr:hypothetical protein [bacterium]